MALTILTGKSYTSTGYTKKITYTNKGITSQFDEVFPRQCMECSAALSNLQQLTENEDTCIGSGCLLSSIIKSTARGWGTLISVRSLCQRWVHGKLARFIVGSLLKDSRGKAVAGETCRGTYGDGRSVKEGVCVRHERDGNRVPRRVITHQFSAFQSIKVRRQGRGGLPFNFSNNENEAVYLRCKTEKKRTSLLDVRVYSRCESRSACGIPEPITLTHFTFLMFPQISINQTVQMGWKNSWARCPKQSSNLGPNNYISVR